MINDKNTRHLAVLSERQKVEFKDKKLQHLAQMGKLTEEVGEVWQEILAHHNSPNKSKSGKGTREAIQEELVDVLTNVLDLLYTFAEDDKDEAEKINEIIAKKMNKWSAKFESVEAELIAEENEYFIYINHTAFGEVNKQTFCVECFRPSLPDSKDKGRYRLAEKFVPFEFYEAVVRPSDRTTNQRERYLSTPRKENKMAVLDYKEVEEFLAKLNHALHRNPKFAETGLQVYLPFDRHLKGNVTHLPSVWSQEILKDKKEKDNTYEARNVILVLNYPTTRQLG